MAWTVEEAVTSIHLFRKGKLTVFNRTLPQGSAAIFDVGIVQALVSLEYATGRFASVCRESAAFIEILRRKLSLRLRPLSVRVRLRQEEQLTEVQHHPAPLVYLRVSSVKAPGKSKFGQHKSCRVYVSDLGNRRNRQGLQKAFGSYRPLRRVWVAQSPPGFRSSSSKTHKMHGTPCVHFTARRFVDAAYASNCRRVSVALRAATLRVSSHKRTVLASPLARSSLRAPAALTWTVRLLSVAEEE
ncbi:hypothetical protein HPB50_029106 [Hyalomma asiaticum]|nr:hypothetical protein HPB50_029106 [Hyalomma asiaticum]